MSKLEKTALGRGRADLDLDLDLQSPMRAMVMMYSHAKVQGQLLVGSEDRVETNGQTDGMRRLHYLPR